MDLYDEKEKVKDLTFKVNLFLERVDLNLF